MNPDGQLMRNKLHSPREQSLIITDGKSISLIDCSSTTLLLLRLYFAITNFYNFCAYYLLEKDPCLKRLSTLKKTMQLTVAVAHQLGRNGFFNMAIGTARSTSNTDKYSLAEN